MGIWSRLEEAATGVERLVFVDADGRPQATIRTRRRVDRHEEVEVAGSDLVGLLFDRAREASLIIRDDSISALHQDVGGIDVSFSGPLPVASTWSSEPTDSAFGPEERLSRPFGMFVGTVRAPAPVEDPRTVLLSNEPGTSLTTHPAGGKPGGGRHHLVCFATGWRTTAVITHSCIFARIRYRLSRYQVLPDA